MTLKVLLVDDDRKTVELVKLYLENEGYDVLPAYDGHRAIHLAREQQPDLVVLDLMLPKLDGMDICRMLRAESRIPIIMLTARTTEEDKLLGLNLGADDYITKPFSPREVLARVKAVLRRAGAGENPAASKIIEFGKLSVDLVKHEARLDQEMVHLTPKEFRLLEIFANNPGKAFSRTELLALAFGPDYAGLERTVDVHIMNLRKKIEKPDEQPAVEIQTVYGIGYRLIEGRDVP